MCFTAVIIPLKQSDDLPFGDLTLDLIQQNYKNNPDGYALRFVTKNRNYVIRTLDFNEYLNYILRNIKELNRASLIHLHLRNATSEVKADSIHLWKIGGYYCGHNGMVDGVATSTKTNECDSLTFLKTIEKHLANNDIAKIAQAIEESSSWGIFLCTSIDGKKVMAFCQNKSLKASLLDSKAFVLSSDEFSIKNKINLDIAIKGKMIKLFGFEFRDMIKKNLRFKNKFYVKGKYMIEKEDFITLIDLENGKYTTKNIESRFGYSGWQMRGGKMYPGWGAYP